MPRKECGFGFSCPPDDRCLPYRSGYKCPGEPCPMSADYICNNDIECYNEYDKCDGTNECEDATDENGCPAKSSLSSSMGVSASVGMIMTIVIILIVVIAIIVRRRKMMQTSFRQAEVVNLQSHPGPANQPMNIQVSQPIYYHPGQHQPTQLVGGYHPVPHPQNPSAPPTYSEAQYYPQK